MASRAGVIQTSYDIVKAQGWEIKVETTQREGTIFILFIPITNSNI